MNKKDKHFKEVMMMAEPPTPGPGFTAMVMNAIEADVQAKTSLKILLQQQLAEGPSFDFTAGVMAQIGAKKVLSVYKPIISQKVWYGIAALLTIFAGAILLTNPSHQTTTSHSLIADLLKPIASLSPVYFMVMLLAVGMLLVDYMVTKPSANSA